MGRHRPRSLAADEAYINEVQKAHLPRPIPYLFSKMASDILSLGNHCIQMWFCMCFGVREKIR